MDDQVHEELGSLAGKNASAIAFANLQFDTDPLIATVLDAALLIRDEPYYMSTWVYVTQWDDGTTIWCAPDGSAMAAVTP